MSWLSSVAQFLRGGSGGSHAARGMPGDADAWTLPYARQVHSGTSPYDGSLDLESTTSVALPGAASTVALDADMAVPENLRGINLRDSSVARSFSRLLAFCDNEYEELRDTINYPAAPEDLAELQHALGFELPKAVYEWFLCCNGQEPESKSSCNDGLFFGVPFLSTDRVIEEWQTWRRVDRDPRAGANRELRSRMASCPAGWVRCEYSHSGWVPLLSDHVGNYIGVDMSPPEAGGGSPGQVIVFGRDFDTKVVVYGCDGIDGWSKFLMLLVSDLEGGILWSAEENEELGERDSVGEDDIGYESYFYGGTAGTSRGGGDGGGEGLVGFRMAGEYRNWPPIEAWADRARRQWETVGLVSSIPVSTPVATTPSLLSSPQDDSFDMPVQGSPQSYTSSLRRRPSRVPSRAQSTMSTRSAEMRRASTLNTEAVVNPFVRGPKNRRATSPLAPQPRKYVPAPAPIADLPTLEEVRALQASEQAAAATATNTTPLPLHDMRASIASLARGNAQPPSYRNVHAQRSGVFDDGLELEHRTDGDISMLRAHDVPEPSTLQDAAVLGSRGSKLREADSDAQYHSTVQMVDTRRLIDDAPTA